MIRRCPRTVRTQVLACVFAATLFSVSGCSTAAAPTPSYGSGAGAPTLAQITPLLERHAHAVLARSSSRFLADVDAAAAASTFRQSQAAQVSALAVVPLRVWSYSVSSPVTDLAAVRAAARRFGAPASIVHLTLSYALDPVDPAAVTHDLWWTFVRRHGHVYVAGDSDMAGLGGQSWKGPWDFGPLVVHRGASSLVLGHPGDAGALAAISAGVDDAVAAVTAVWGPGWNRQVAVIVPGSAAEFAAMGGTRGPTGSTGSASLGGDVSAETVFETANGTDSAARVLMNPAVLNSLTATGRAIVLRHEITHVATEASTPIGTPTWLVEGFAEYVGNLGSGQSVPTAAGELRVEVRAGHLPAALPSESDFASTTRLAAVYEQAWLACRFIAARAGQSGLVQLYRLVGASLDPAAVAVSTAFRTVLHESVPAFTGQWRAYVAAELR